MATIRTLVERPRTRLALAIVGFVLLVTLGAIWAVSNYFAPNEYAMWRESSASPCLTVVGDVAVAQITLAPRDPSEDGFWFTGVDVRSDDESTSVMGGKLPHGIGFRAGQIAPDANQLDAILSTVRQPDAWSQGELAIELPHPPRPGEAVWVHWSRGEPGGYQAFEIDTPCSQ